MMKIIDISTYQPNVNFNAVKNSGVEGVIVRAGFGYSTVDDAFHNNIKNAIAAGLHVGAYWFGYAVNDSSAKEEADFCAKTIAPYKDKLDLGVYYDWEYDSMRYARSMGVYPGKSAITSMNKTFCEELLAKGYSKVGYYLNLDYSRNYIDESQLTKYLRWFAYYGEQQNDCYIQQYTSSGRVDGVAGNVDMNWLIKGDISPVKPVPTPAPKPETIPAGQHTYTVKPGDTLSAIAAKYGTTYQKIAADNGISNPDIIYPGQVLKINTGKSTGEKYYTVVKGDTLSGIASRYGTTVAQLAEWNNIKDVNLIYPGQKFRVR